MDQIGGRELSFGPADGRLGIRRCVMCLVGHRGTSLSVSRLCLLLIGKGRAQRSLTTSGRLFAEIDGGRATSRQGGGGSYLVRITTAGLYIPLTKQRMPKRDRRRSASASMRKPESGSRQVSS